jgi:hypothetical protein
MCRGIGERKGIPGHDGRNAACRIDRTTSVASLYETHLHVFSSGSGVFFPSFSVRPPSFTFSFRMSYMLSGLLIFREVFKNDADDG